MLGLCLTLALSGMPSNARLLDAPPLEQMTLPELEEERVRLKALIPSKAGAIALLIGLPIAAYGVITLAPVLFGTSMGALTAMTVITVVVASAGVIAAVIWLIVAIRDGVVLREQIAEVDRQISRARPYAPPPLPPPPLLPVPGVHAPGFVPQVQLARF